MKKANEVISDLSKQSLASMGVESKEQTASKQDLFPATDYKPKSVKRHVYSAPVTTRRPVMPRQDWLKSHPEAATPSVMSKAKVDKTLLACQELPTPDQPIKNYAGYSRKEWDKLVGVMTSYMGDVAEGAGLIYKGGMFGPDDLHKGMSMLLQKCFKHCDPYDKRYRSISVDGRIDSDERKP